MSGFTPRLEPVSEACTAAGMRALVDDLNAWLDVVRPAAFVAYR
jgi:hypothetical protein